MQAYRLYVNDRNYGSWELIDTIELTRKTRDICPLESKLFSNDVFTIDNNNRIQLVHSSVRSGGAMPGVLILHGNKTYGRMKHRLLYKCIPDDTRIPPFLVPYEMKQMGFSKVFVNLYVTFSFLEWTDKHPIGVLNHVIGAVNELDHFYEYLLYCKSLNVSIQKFQKDAVISLRNRPHQEFFDDLKIKYPKFEDRSSLRVFSIDPVNSVDFDDAFSIRTLDNGIQQLSIYISNVAVLMDSLSLWESFSRRVSTIYLPDKKRPMMPTVLSDCLCSLQENVTRVAFVMDLFIRDDDIIDIKYNNCFVKVTRNFRYEEADLFAFDDYHVLLETTKRLSLKNKYVTTVRNSHDVVCHLMILMNYHCAQILLKSATGIFRMSVTKNDIVIPDNLPEDVGLFIKIWNSSSGQYIDGTKNKIIRHDMLKMDAYVHTTSPIRRLVDLLNIIKLQELMGLFVFSDGAQTFYEKWLGELDYINTTMRSIRKMQCDCNLLDLCSNDASVLEKEYDGYMFDKIIRTDGLNQYIVFIPELKMSSRVTTTDDIANYERRKFKMYLFHNEDTFKRKIRLHLIGEPRFP
jgi:exoribonuclease R